MRSLMFRIRTVVNVPKMYDFSLSLCPWTTNRALYSSLPVLGFLIARKIRRSGMLELCGILFEGMKENAFRANYTSI